MRAVVKRKREPGAEIEEVDKPVPGKCEVLVKVTNASICGTDVHIWDWNHWAQHPMVTQDGITSLPSTQTPGIP
jgi:threonine 3-dehydrogenase